MGLPRHGDKCIIYNLAYGPKKWSEHYPVCGGKRQSPIRMESEHAEKPLNEMFSLELFTGNEDGIIYGQLMNDGYHLSMLIYGAMGRVEITGGPLNGIVFSLYNFHFHYSCDEYLDGSEHSLDGEKYEGEARGFLHIASSSFL
ncbi:Carbonic anhydrase 1 [Thelohanellus kitauei]|uniref:carbonic anhydrase n=1 Tax=Thelohanellus kitauei TaxID=669202 RepID=A0A0C2J5G3_THEKT|nr:Carbonic anhydrase 1 [Thelohanellus kitauei]